MKNYRVILSVALLIQGCSAQPPTAPPQIKAAPAIIPEPPTHLDPTITPLAIPSGWNELTIIANSAKTKIGTGGHFSTSRNACGHEAYGGVELDSWNSLVSSLNTVLQKEVILDNIHDTIPHDDAHEEVCVSIPDSTPYMDGTVELKTNSEAIKTLYQLKGDQICGPIQDTKVSEVLLSSITKIIAAADKEDCPNGWGSNFINP